MKKSDIAMIILIASISVLISYFVAKAVVGDVQNESVQVKTTDPITTNVDEPDISVFNSDAINPTVEVIIGGDKQGTESESQDQDEDQDQDQNENQTDDPDQSEEQQ
jgi:hypothetical protein